jgi:HEAT repeat protein
VMTMKLSALSIGIALAVGLQAQSIGMPPEGFPDIGDPCCIAGGVPRTIEQMLERRGVQLTPEAVVNALVDSRAVVRSLAAKKLAQDKRREAVPEIVAALSAEHASGTREILAFAAASLGAAQGFDTLASICKGAAGSIVLRMTAAQDMLSLHDESCVDGLLGSIRSAQASSPLDRSGDSLVNVGLSAFNVFQFQHLSASQEGEIRDLAARGLTSAAAEVRLAAARALAKFGDPASVLSLQKAVDTEQDQFARPRMLEALKQLEERQSGSEDKKK